MIDTSAVFRDLSSRVALNQGPPFSAEWTVPKDLPYFNGHFPGNPVFPAVGILDATLHLMGIFLKRADLQAQSVIAAKFLNLIGPGQRVRIEFQSLNERDWQADWKDSESAKPLATLKVRV